MPTKLYYVKDLVEKRPETASLSLYITDEVANNYCKGLNGTKYKKRLNEGIEIATQSIAKKLPEIIKALIADRLKKGAPSITSGEATSLSEAQQRALILALWSNRVPKISLSGKIDISPPASYRPDEDHIPVWDLYKPSPQTTMIQNSPQDKGYEPTMAEFEIFLRSFPRNSKISIDEAFDNFEKIYTANGHSLKSGWRQRLEEKLSQSKRK